MTNKNSNIHHKQQVEPENLGWGSILAGSIFILTGIFILGFFWQAILSYV
jgi:hypothetical protein